jgi:Trk K+ transport system NAD-binding subunit
MSNIVFLIFRRMRRPLITLVIVYAIAVLGLVLIPGQTESGDTWHMDIFHAFYFVSYMSTTIGFGEIPHAFTPAQRLWVTFTLYASVIAWLYAIGNIFSLLQDKTFQRALAESRIARHIKSLREPFYLICGYGETGAALVRGLTDAGRHAVVIEIDEFRSNLIKLDGLREHVPVLHGDARKPRYLRLAGLEHPQCLAVVAVTNDNDANLKIAITSKLLHPRINVICRADSHDVEKNMASFGTNHIVDPYDTFALYLATALNMPCLYLMQNWLFSAGGNQVLSEPVYPPRDKRWVICGYGRFGKALHKRLVEQGVEVVVIEAEPEKTGEPRDGVVRGRGTEADTLVEAGVERACGLIAGTDNDANNLSIVVTARELNPDLFLVVRQNHSGNRSIIDAVNADIVMHPSKIIADKIRVLLGMPMLHEFFTLAKQLDNEWACELISRISALIGGHTPRLEQIRIDAQQAPAVVSMLDRGEAVRYGELQRDPWQRENPLQCIVLMLRHNDKQVLLPLDDTLVREDDRFLVCGPSSNLTRLYWNLQQENVLRYVCTGRVHYQSWLWKSLFGRD